MRTQRIGDVDVIRDLVEVPGIGALPINAFVVHADEPVLVDTGRPLEKEAFLSALSSVIDPADIQWIWLTHPDRDHMGALFDVLSMAPKARLVSTYAAVGYLSVEFPMPMDRVYLLNPGQTLSVGGGRGLHAFRPPLFDSPMTVGFFDDASGFAFSSDCFGAALPTVEAADLDDVREAGEDTLRDGLAMWVGVDSPWVSVVDSKKFGSSYDELRRFEPNTILSAHLPPAPDSLKTFLDFLELAPRTTPFVGPDQAQLEAMMQQMHGVPG